MIVGTKGVGVVDKMRSTRASSLDSASTASLSHHRTPSIQSEEKERDGKNPTSMNIPSQSMRLPEATSGSIPINQVTSAALSEKVKVSGKIIAYLSGKLNAVAPLVSLSVSMDDADRRDYEHLAVISAGGVLDEGMEEALQTRFGLRVQGDVEVGEGKDGDFSVERDEAAGDVPGIDALASN